MKDQLLRRARKSQLLSQYESSLRECIQKEGERFLKWASSSSDEAICSYLEDFYKEETP
jgi:hypothetical protein